MNPVVHFEMPAENRKRMAEFYTKVFGWKTEQLGEDMGRRPEKSGSNGKVKHEVFGSLERPIAKMMIENAKNGKEVVIELTPKFFSTWDFAKAQ